MIDDIHHRIVITNLYLLPRQVESNTPKGLNLSNLDSKVKRRGLTRSVFIYRKGEN